MNLADRIAADTYAGYAYAYPHKTSYRALNPAVPLADAWAGEDRSALFLYTHLPFCEMRCGFCNLFTTVRPDADFVDATLSAIRRQSQVVADAVQPGRVAMAAFGGGTPSYLNTAELERLFTGLAEDWPVEWGSVPTSFEISPGTVDPEKLAALKAFGVDRISMGVQSFVPADLKALGRPQKLDQVREVCGWIRDADVPVFNLDLIYGSAGQTVGGWRHSLEEAVAQGPNELYLYPLYIRELTGLARTGKRPGEHRRELYRMACDFLGEAGFEQISMRLFRKPSAMNVAAGNGTPDYCCQEDGMVGLGPGARSYTQALHYSSEYAVSQPGVRQIIRAFQETRDFSVADFGVQLDVAEQQRRYLIKSLLRCDGVDLAAFEAMFGQSVRDTFPQLTELEAGGYAGFEADRFILTDAGLAHSDTIGPWLYSPEVEARMEACELV